MSRSVVVESQKHHHGVILRKGIHQSVLVRAGQSLHSELDVVLLIITRTQIVQILSILLHHQTVILNEGVDLVIGETVAAIITLATVLSGHALVQISHRELLLVTLLLVSEVSSSDRLSSPGSGAGLLLRRRNRTQRILQLMLRNLE